MAASAKVIGADKVIARLRSMKDVSLIKDAILSGGLMVESAAKESIAHGNPSGRIYKRGNVTHQASAPGQPPASDSGVLVSSITHRLEDDGLTVVVGSNTPQATHTEYGTRNMAARPWLHPAFEKCRGAIKERLAQALQRMTRKK